MFVGNAQRINARIIKFINAYRNVNFAASIMVTSRVMRAREGLLKRQDAQSFS